MKRIKFYLAALVIPAIPYLLMIYYPETLDPVFKHLASANGIYTWIVVLNVFFISFYFMIRDDLKSYKAHKNWYSYIKLLLVLCGILGSIYILFDGSVWSVKYVFYGTVFAAMSLYLYIHHAKKT